MVFGEQENNEGLCSFLFRWGGLCSLGGLGKRITRTFQGRVILDSRKDNRAGSLKVETDLCQGSYRLKMWLPTWPPLVRNFYVAPSYVVLFSLLSLSVLTGGPFSVHISKARSSILSPSDPWNYRQRCSISQKVRDFGNETPLSYQPSLQGLPPIAKPETSPFWEKWMSLKGKWLSPDILTLHWVLNCLNWNTQKVS